jgi:hypothetical protein
MEIFRAFLEMGFFRAVGTVAADPIRHARFQKSARLVFWEILAMTLGKRRHVFS